jgi:hypothetical protein
MLTRSNSSLYFLLAGQFVAIFLLYHSLHWLLSATALALFKGMHTWNTATICLCWLFQYAFIVVTIQLREALIRKLQHRLFQIPLSYLRFALFLFNCPVIWVLFSSIKLLSITIGPVSFTSLTAFLLLVIQVWGLCGCAIPMSAKRFHRYFFSPAGMGNGGKGEWAIVNGE